MSDRTQKPLYILLYAAVTSLVFTGAIMSVNALTVEKVQRNRKLSTAKAVVQMFGLGDVSTLSDEQITDLVSNRVAGEVYDVKPGKPGPSDPRREPIQIVDPVTGAKLNVLVAFKQPIAPDAEIDIHDTKNILAYGFDIEGVGFWATIKGKLAVSPDFMRVVGIVFTAHSETPGLGGRITESSFRQEFEGLNISAPPEGQPFVYVQHADFNEDDPRSSRHVDALTGATGTSTAVDAFLNKDIERIRRAASHAGLIDKTPEGGGE